MDTPQYELAFQVLAHGQRSGHTELAATTFRSEESWSAHCEAMHDGGVGARLRTQPDWENQMLVEVPLETRNSTGYTVEVASLVVDGEAIRIHAVEHGPESVAGAAETQPFAVVVTAANDRPVELDLTVVADL